MSQAVRLTLVHHANQFLLTEGYQNRDGIAQTVQGYASVLQAHAAHDVPCGLHLSGTLIEAIAWSSPWFFTLVHKLRERGLVELIGGTYAENIMTLTPDDSSRRQIDEYFKVFEKHLGHASELEWFWVPERNWNSERFSSLIQDSSLVNGGYKGVFLDHRLLFSSNRDSLLRSDVDRLGPWAKSGEPLSTRLGYLTHSQRELWIQRHGIHELAGLQVAAISEHLRYWIPLRDGDQARLQDLASILLADPSSDSGAPVIFFADELERVAGVAGWDSTGLKRYCDFLEWLKSQSQFKVKSLQMSQKPKKISVIEPGSFYELEETLRAGSESLGFTLGSEARAAFAQLNLSREAVAALGTMGEARLTELAWKHVLASEYETLWHDLDSGGVSRLAPWAKAVASHSRHSLIVVEAAKWFGKSDRGLEFEERDLDGDGEREIILKNKTLFAIFSRGSGGRLLALFYLSSVGGAMMIGNITDDWNWQSDLNSFMQIPANHPGAFCDRGGENDSYALVLSHRDQEKVEFSLLNDEPGSRWWGTTKTFTLRSESSSLFARYDLPEGDGFETVVSLSPDYLSLLREGSENSIVKASNNEFSVTRAGVCAEIRSSDARLQPDGIIGHGWNARLMSSGPELHLEIQCRTV